jgi:predicted transcriptional regulator/DNA-binding MarR family transcriptional regulator
MKESDLTSGAERDKNMGIESRRASWDKPRRFRRAEVDEVLADLKHEDLQILRWLLRSPFSRAQDLALARSSRPSTVYRHLAFLQRLGVVESLTPAALGRMRCSLYHLSNLGIHVLATQMHRSVTALARDCHSDEQSLRAYLPRLDALVTLQDLINGLHALAPEKLSLFGHPASVWWACVRDYRHAFSYRERSCVAQASGGLVLQVRPRTAQGKDAPDRWYSLFILLDNGIHSVDLITGRLRGLFSYRESPERWSGEQSHYHAFPTILVLATTAHRREHWVRKAQEVAAHMRVAPLEGAITSLEEMQREENLPQFPWLLPWRSLSNHTACHLQDLLEPMPEEALPPGLLLPHEWQDLDFEDLPPAVTPRQMGRPLATVIQGHFTLRAEQMIRMQQSEKPTTREHMALLSLMVTRRLLDLLTFILDHPMISINELAALHDMQLASMERSMRELRGLGCLELVDTKRYQQEIHKRAPEGLREKLVVKTDIGQRWQLSACGMRLLAATSHFSLHTIVLEEDREQQGHEEELESLIANGWSSKDLIQRTSAGLFGLRRVEHNTGVYGFFAQLCQAAQREREQGRRHHLLWWEMGIFIERRYRDHDRMHNLRPDAMAAYQVGERTLRFWLEWDRHTMSTKDLTEKFASYQYYIRAREWSREQMLLPWLLIVVPDHDQELRMARIAVQHLEAASGLTLRITTASRIANLGPLAEIWLPVLPVREARQDQHLGTPRSRFFEVDPKKAL